MCVDPQRVYSTGMSNGGGLTVVLACAVADRFAAFAPVAVTAYSNLCAQAQPVPIVAFAGTADPIVPFTGGKVQCCGGATVLAAPDSMAAWARHDGCGVNFTDARLSSEVTRRTWSGCRAGSAVVFYIIEGGGHTWPGAIPIQRFGLTTKQIDASSTIWQFFSEHALATG